MILCGYRNAHPTGQQEPLTIKTRTKSPFEPFGRIESGENDGNEVGVQEVLRLVTPFASVPPCLFR